MAFSLNSARGSENRYGSTVIRDGRRDNLIVCWDSDDSEAEDIYPVLFFTPDMENTNDHHHIELDEAGARALHEWLGKYLACEERRK